MDESLRVFKSPYPKRRFGRPNDGGYVVMMGEIDSYDGFVSAGIGDDDSFELDFLDAHDGLMGTCFDGSISEMPRGHDRLSFVPRYVGVTPETTVVRLSDRLCGPDGEPRLRNAFLKMDIEGDEYACLDDLFVSGRISDVKQLVVEFHDAWACPDHMDVLNVLARTHTLLHLHPNNALGVAMLGDTPVPRCMECTYVRTRDIAVLPLEHNCAGIPDGALDMPNVPGRPDIPLTCPPYIKESQAKLNMAVFLEDMGDVAGALALYRELRAADPSLTVYFNMALLLWNAFKRDEEALVCLDVVLRMDPGFEPAQNIMASILHEEVLDSLRDDRVDAPYTMGLAIRSHSKCWKSETSWASVGVACMAAGLVNTYLPAFLTARALHPDWKVLAKLLFLMLVECHRYGEALELAKDVPDRDEAISNSLAICLMHFGRAAEAHAALARGDPATMSTASLNLLGGSLIELGEADAAMGVYRAGWKRFAGVDGGRMLLTAFGENALLSSNYVRGGEDESSGLHREWGTIANRAYGTRTTVHVLRAPAGRLVRVGYIGSDFREHAVGYFSHHLLTRFDPARFAVYVYDCNPDLDGQDSVTREIRARCTAYVDASGRTAATVCDRIESDGIDILVDLSGHTSGCNMEVLAMKPARTTVSMIGYCNTTGLANVDHRIVDDITDPPVLGCQTGAPEPDRRCTERSLLRVDGCFLCFTPTLKFEDAAHLPSCERAAWPSYPGPRFGSFAKLCKVTDDMWLAWDAVVDRVPGSRLVLKSKCFLDPKSRDRLFARLAALGVHGLIGRIVPLAHAPTTLYHLREFGRVDLMLDTHPYSGTTITCESLMMGVPVVTMRGIAHASNVSASILTNCGMGANVCDDTHDYMQRAVELVRAPPAREDVRRTFLTSPVCDAARHVRKIEDAYMEMVK
jgi:hypothetical protein